MGLEQADSAWEFQLMNAVKVDDQQRIQLSVLKPGDYYEPQMHGENEITLRKVAPPKLRMTKEEILRAIEQSPIEFTASWDELKEDIR